jgi:peptidoglycan hydrolase CwlO-like protein
MIVISLKKSHSQTQNLEKELHEFKDKWASTQCDLIDAKSSLEETQKDLKQTYLALEGSFKKIKDLNKQIRAYEEMLDGKSAMNPSETKKVCFLIISMP